MIPVHTIQELIFSTSIFGFKSINSFLYGKSNPNINKTGILKDFEELTSSSFSMGLFKETIDKGIIGMQISQPLRLEKGTASFQLPVGRTRDRNVLFENFIYDFSPSGRQIDLELLFGKSYKNLSFNSRLGFLGIMSKLKVKISFSSKEILY